MIQTFASSFWTLWSGFIQDVRFGEYDSRVLHEEVLETNEVKVLSCLLFVEQLHVDVSDQVLHLHAVCQEHKLVVLQKFDGFNQAESFFSDLVIFKIVDTFNWVHGGTVFYKQEPSDSMIFPKQILDEVRIFRFHESRRVELKLFIFLNEFVPEPFLFEFCFTTAEASKKLLPL